ncbi:MAG: peptide chain release factor N(5)-glutamine methyltransferase [Hydrogenophaga sp.]|nr:peptide chain release factor N(5)-glutamine methyltransferase [Hydrogenophaga sp.]
MTAPKTTVGQTLAQAGTQGLDRLDAQMLLLHALGRPTNQRAWLLSHDTDPLPDGAQALFDALVQRRLQGEPMAYLTGEQEFFGLMLRVDTRVLVPRADTETLVEWALDVLHSAPAGGTGAKVLDLGTGSGAIALAVQSACPGVRTSATDASPQALAVAKANAERLRLPVEFFEGHWFDAVPGRCFDLIVSNPPYIAEHDPHLPALTHEPISALTAGLDGLDDLRHIIDAAASGSLSPGGWLLLEHGYDQAAAVRALLQAAGFEQVSSRRDIAGIERCSGGCWRQGR